MTSSLTAYWDFEGSAANNAAGSGGAAHNGTLMGNATVTGTPKAGAGALSLDGNGDYLDVTASVNVNEAWTVSAWFLPAVAPAGTSRGMIYESVGTPTSTGYTMSMGIREGSATGDTGFQLFTDTATGADPNAQVQIADGSAIGTWHHIISVFTPSTLSTPGAVIGYLDGVQQYNLVIPANTLMVAADGFHIGTYRSANDRWFNGLIDEVAIWSRGLTAPEVLEVYQRGAGGQAIPEPSAPLLAGLGILGLLRHRRRASTFPSTRPGKRRVAGGLALLATPLLCQPAQADLLTELKGYYPFESQAAGSAPNVARSLGMTGFDNDGARLFGGESGAASVPLSIAPGTFRAGTGALACDGTGDFSDLAVSPIVVTGDFSVSVWFKPQTGGAGLTGTARAFVFESKPAYAVSFGLRAGSGGNASFQFYADITEGADPNLSYELPNSEVDQWHHFVYTYDLANTTVKGYLDGELRYEIFLPAPLLDITGFNTGTYRSANGRWFSGFIDEQVFWQRALTPEEIGAVFTGGGGNKTFAVISAEAGNAALKTGLAAYYPYDSHNDREVANAAVALGAPGFAGDSALLTGDYVTPDNIVPPLTTEASQARSGTGALLCDGVNNYASIDGNPVDPTLGWSVSAWFRPDTGGLGYESAATRAFIYETGVNYPISLGLRGGAASDTTNIQMFSLLNTGTAVFAGYELPSAQLDQWHHFAQVYDPGAGTITGYLDGVVTHTLSDTVDGTQYPLQSYTGFRLGTYRVADGRWFKGLIDEVAMWQRPLAESEVRQVLALGQAGVALTGGGPAPEITGFTGVPGSPGAWQITWTTTAGLKYALEASSDLKDWSTTLAEELPATGTSLSFQIVPSLPAPAGALYDPGAAAGKQRFYRARIKL
ncbi:MAG: LamG domain-containing protein [Verrucomicrobiota bacterium]